MFRPRRRGSLPSLHLLRHDGEGSYSTCAAFLLSTSGTARIGKSAPKLLTDRRIISGKSLKASVKSSRPIFAAPRQRLPRERQIARFRLQQHFAELRGLVNVLVRLDPVLPLLRDNELMQRVAPGAGNIHENSPIGDDDPVLRFFDQVIEITQRVRGRVEMGEDESAVFAPSRSWA